jgi:hypothetical protein
MTEIVSFDRAAQHLRISGDFHNSVRRIGLAFSKSINLMTGPVRRDDSLHYLRARLRSLLTPRLENSISFWRINWFLIASILSGTQDSSRVGLVVFGEGKIIKLNCFLLSIVVIRRASTRVGNFLAKMFSLILCEIGWHLDIHWWALIWF